MGKQNPKDPKAFGQPITLKDANEMIEEFNDLDKVIVKTISKKCPDAKKSRAKVLRSRKYNAFIFHKDLIDRFFHTSNSGDESAEYLMLLLGAHKSKKGFFKAGSFTVIATGCNLKKVRGQKEPSFFPIRFKDQDPASEYPPRRVVSKLGIEATESISFVAID